MPGMFPAFLTSSPNINELANEALINLLQTAVNLITSSEYILVPFILAFFEGQLWIYIICLHPRVTKKSRKILNTWYARIALGLAWEALVLIPIYLIHCGNLMIQVDNLMQIEFTALMVSFALQLPILGLITFLRKGEQKK